MNSYQKVKNWVIEKFNPAQRRIAEDSGSSVSTDASITYSQAFTKLESVNRGVNMIVTACASFDYDIKDKVADGIMVGMRQKQLSTLLNFRPNPYQSAQDFRKNIFTDFILEGNAFIYYDGAFIYHLPASKVEILTDEKTFIKGYKYNGVTTFGEH